MKRLRSLGLMVLFSAIYFALVAASSAALPGGGMLVSTLSSLIAALVAAALLLRLVERRPVRDLGFDVRPQTPRELLVGLALPCAALLVIMAGLILLRSVSYQPDDGNAASWGFGLVQLLFALAIPAAAEEALFRGYPFQKLVEAAGPVLATLLASAGFAIAHRHNPGVGAFALINIFVAGVMLSLAYLRTRSLWFATAIHLGWNWQMAGPLDLPVSGLELFDTPMYDARESGAVWLTGGAFGPEGGVAGLFALSLLTAAVWFYTKRNYQDHD